MDMFAETLKQKGLKATKFRKTLLKTFADCNSSLTTNEVVKNLESRYNKATIYRAIYSFEKNGIIHQVPDAKGLSRYALCMDNCSPGIHHHLHAHLICNQCDQTYCIQEISVPSLSNAYGLNIENAELTLKGNCRSCRL